MSESSLLHCGVPQDSVLGPIFFLVCTYSLLLLLAFYGVDSHFYADDCQIYLLIADIAGIKTNVLALLSDIKTLMRERKFSLNESKTEIMLIKGNLRANVTQEFDCLDVEASTLVPGSIVRNFGISFDPELSFKK